MKSVRFAVVSALTAVATCEGFLIGHPSRLGRVDARKGALLAALALFASCATSQAASDQGSVALRSAERARQVNDALTPAIVVRHLNRCAAEHPIVRLVPAERAVGIGLRESGLNPLAIHDNTNGQAYFPKTLNDAVAWVTSLQKAGHRLDAGVMQINQSNWPAYGLTTKSVFDPRANICAGARILAEAYQIERRVACRYNTGRPYCNNGYPESIERAVQGLVLSIVPASTASRSPITPRTRARAEAVP
jgi:hypothetical protein